MIEVHDLRKSFGERRAVDGVSFTVERGECFGLLGPNGAGKTTTMHMTIGVLRPDGGTITINGKPDPMQPEVRRHLGLAPQKLSLYEELTADENLHFFGKLYGLAGAALKKRVDWAFEFAQLTDRRRDRVGAYSGGMKRRLNLAAALLHEPPVVLCDEPTVGVDPQSRNTIFESLEQLKAAGTTVIYTTHYMEEAERLCDRVAIIDHGKILALDSVRALIRAHGGDAQVQAELTAPPEAPLDVPGKLAVDGASLTLATSAPLEAIGTLARAGVAFHTLHVEQPNLEGVFLNLTGRSLRDE